MKSMGVISSNIKSTQRIDLNQEKSNLSTQINIYSAKPTKQISLKQVSLSNLNGAETNSSFKPEYLGLKASLSRRQMKSNNTLGFSKHSNMTIY